MFHFIRCVVVIIAHGNAGIFIFFNGAKITIRLIKPEFQSGSLVGGLETTNAREGIKKTSQGRIRNLSRKVLNPSLRGFS